MEHLTGAGYAGLALSAVSVGLGLSLLLAQHPTRSSVSISSSYLFLGFAVASALPLLDQVDEQDPAWYTRLTGLWVAGIILGSAWYLLALLDTAVVAPREERRIGALIRW